MPKEANPRLCSIAAALRVVGGTWTLLVVRELFYHSHRFDVIVRNTGMSRDILANRLRALVAEGVVERLRYCDHPPRYEYRLTRKGRDLGDVLHALMRWGEMHGDVRPDPLPVRVCARCARV